MIIILEYFSIFFILSIEVEYNVARMKGVED